MNKRRHYLKRHKNLTSYRFDVIYNYNVIICVLIYNTETAFEGNIQG